MPHKAPRLGQKPKRQRYPDSRESAAARGYGHTWRKLRAQVLAGDPLCVRCLELGIVTPATDVDHIVPKSRGGEDAYANLQPRCHSCHSRKTGLEDR